MSQSPSDIGTLEKVDRERFEMFYLVPLSAAAPMAIARPASRGEALALFAKWIAIQRMHGAADSDLVEFGLNYIGLGKETGQSISKDPKKLTGAIIGIAHNMLVACEHLLAGHGVAEVQEMCASKGRLPPGVVVPLLRRAQELVQYSRGTGIAPFEFERQEAKSVDGAEPMSFEDAWILAFERMGMGYGREEIEGALAGTGLPVSVDGLAELWAVVRRSRGREAQILSALQGSTDDDLKRKLHEKLFAAATEALRRCRAHPAYRIFESFNESQGLNGRLGCLQVPTTAVVFIILLFTPLAWWISFVSSLGLLVAMVTGRTIWDKIDISRTVSGILEACPQGSPRYVEAYRLFAKAREWDDCPARELKQIVARLPAVDISVRTARDRSERRPAFHGFFYRTDRTGNTIRLDMSVIQQRAFLKICRDGDWQDLDDVTYWRRCYPWIRSAAGQGYVAWKGRSYWLLYATKLHAKDEEENATYGVHMIEFTKNKMRYKWIETGGPGAFSGALRNLLEVMCNWNVHDVGLSRSIRLGAADMAILRGNIGWTDEMHQRMAAQHPNVEDRSSEAP